MKFMKFVSLTTLVAVMAGVLSGCIIETRRPHLHRPVVIVPVR